MPLEKDGFGSMSPYVPWHFKAGFPSSHAPVNNGGLFSDSRTPQIHLQAPRTLHCEPCLPRASACSRKAAFCRRSCWPWMKTRHFDGTRSTHLATCGSLATSALTDVPTQRFSSARRRMKLLNSREWRISSTNTARTPEVRCCWHNSCVARALARKQPSKPPFNCTCWILFERLGFRAR
jgi:hypothetical protein